MPLTLPCPAQELLPHRAPMRLVDTLVTVGPGQRAVADALVRQDGVLVSTDGVLDPVALLELMAQTYAALRGFDDRTHGRPVRQGFLVGCRDLRILAPARIGAPLRITVACANEFAGFVVADGTVEQDGSVLASGSLKLYIADPEEG